MARVAAEPLEERPVECRHLGPHQGSVRWPPGRAVDQYEGRDAVGDDVRAMDGQAESNGAAHGMADDDGLPQVESLQHRGRVVDEPAEAEHRRHRGRPSEAAVIHGHHTPTLGREPGGQQSEDPEGCTVTVEQHHRASRPALLDMEATTLSQIKRNRASTTKPDISGPYTVA